MLDKPNLYRKIALWCEKKSIICDLSLSASGQKSLTTKLNSALPRNYYVKVREFGLATVYFPCDESKKTDLKEKQALVKKIVKNFWNLEKLSYVCQASSLNTFIFQAKIVVMETQEAKQLGFHADSLFSLSLADPSYHISSLHHLQNLVKNKKAHVVGEPLLFVQQNQEMQVKSGGEIPVMNSDRNKNEPADLQWKTFGLDLKVKIVPLDEQQVSLTYVISLSLPKAFGGKYSFQSNNIQSCIKLDLGSPKQIAAITLSSKSQEHDYRTGFSKLPLIGPLFKVKENDYGLSKLFLWVAIAEDKK